MYFKYDWVELINNGVSYIFYTNKVINFTSPKKVHKIA